MPEDLHDHHHHVITFYVNGEACRTEVRVLSVGQILGKAGFDPPSDYRLTIDSNGKVYTDSNAQLDVHEDERFTATYVGPTEVSFNLGGHQ